MPTSLYLAQLIGPILVALGAGMVVNRAGYGAIVTEALRSQAIIFLSGLLSITAGLAIVLAHNVWAADWRIIITILGWLGFIGGIVRVIWPQQTQRIAGTVYANPLTLPIGGAVTILLGLILCYFGYIR
jgi:hypothetical protein